MRNAILSSFVLAASLGGTAAAAAPAPKAPPYDLPALSRADFNRLAAVAGSPLFWRVDSDNPGAFDTNELALLNGAAAKKYVAKDGLTFTKEFEKTYRALVELRRREAVAKELMQGRPTLVETDLTHMAPEDQKIIMSLMKAGQQIDALYAKQNGTLGMEKKVAKDDWASAALMWRNHGPQCEAPGTQNDPFCYGLSSFAQPVPASWPADVKVDKAFCEAIGQEPNAKELQGPFTVVKKAKKGGYETVPYTKAYGSEMRAIAATLKATAKLVKTADEEAFKTYLLAAAKAFENNDWEAADEAWSKMNGDNSRWYLRIGPDETYWDACGVKAGFHMSYALVDKSSLEWKTKLTAVRSEMEAALANLIGAPYVKREVAFELPEFIDIIQNAGDSRSSTGATVGQSLPNVGKVADESRGRTVAMVNLYTDADSLADITARDRSLFGDATFAFASDDMNIEHVGTVLHEATHNLGPYGSWKVDGKSPEEIFGGPTAAILEELKAQTGALYFMSFLLQKGLIAADDMKRSFEASISWAFGHISRGMTTGDGTPKTYSQLSAIQVGALIDAGAMTWVEGQATDPGRWEIDFDKTPAAIEALMKQVGQIKASGDVAGAKALIAKYTSPEGQAKMHADVITERVLRFPKASFVYGVKL